MSKVFRPYEPEQMLLMPASLQEWLPPDHLAYFISDVVEHLDLSAVMTRYEDEELGYPPYHPRMMVKVLLYAYCIGVPSSRKIEKRLREDIAFRVLALPGKGWQPTIPRTSALSQISGRITWKRWRGSSSGCSSSATKQGW